MEMRSIVSLIDIVLLPLIIAGYGLGIGWIVNKFQKGILEVKIDFEAEIKRIILYGVAQADYVKTGIGGVRDVQVMKFYKIKPTGISSTNFYSKWIETIHKVKDICYYYNDRYDFCEAIKFYYRGRDVCVVVEGTAVGVLCAGA